MKGKIAMTKTIITTITEKKEVETSVKTNYERRPFTYIFSDKK